MLFPTGCETQPYDEIKVSEQLLLDNYVIVRKDAWWHVTTNTESLGE